MFSLVPSEPTIQGQLSLPDWTPACRWWAQLCSCQGVCVSVPCAAHSCHTGTVPGFLTCLCLGYILFQTEWCEFSMQLERLGALSLAIFFKYNLHFSILCVLGTITTKIKSLWNEYHYYLNSLKNCLVHQNTVRLVSFRQCCLVVQAPSWCYRVILDTSSFAGSSLGAEGKYILWGSFSQIIGG